MDNNNNKASYKKQTFLSLFQFGSEVINFLVIAISAFMSKSLIMWMDLINSSGNTMRTGFTAVFAKKMTKDLRFRYNYGTDKAEALMSLFCDCFVFIGLAATLIFSVLELFTPRPLNNHILVAVGIKLVCVICDIPMVVLQYKIKKENNGQVADSNFVANIASLLFDVAAFISLGVVWLTRGLPIARYVSPTLSIIIAIFLLFVCIKHILASVSDLTDKALPEDEQIKILKIIMKNVDDFEAFGSIKTRHNGATVYIDLLFDFDDSMPYGNIKELRSRLQTALEQEIEGCVVTVMIE